MGTRRPDEVQTSMIFGVKWSERDHTLGRIRSTRHSPTRATSNRPQRQLARRGWLSITVAAKGVETVTGLQGIG